MKQFELFDLPEFEYMHIKKKYVTEENVEGGLIAESFGIQGGYMNLIADIIIPKDFKIIYITGESGSGKTTILKEIIRQQNYKTSQLTNEIKEKPIFLIGGGQDKSLAFLTSVGLSDATLWLNNYYQLSDSQKARFEIAEKMMKDEVICVDEFLSTLDRKTALPVAYSIQRAIRKHNKKMIVATAHDDLIDYLKPDVVIRGRAFPSRWEVKKMDVTAENPITKRVVLRYGTKEDYKNEKLGELHYKGKYTGGVKEYLFADYNGNVIGLLVSIFNMHNSGRRISRVVVHPSYRGCGVAQMMIKKYLNDYPNTDVVAAMAMFNPVFEKAGMKRVEDVRIVPPNGLVERLEQLGFDKTKWHDRTYLKRLCGKEEVRKVISEYSNKASHIVCPAGEYLEECKIKEKIINEVQTASRVLFGLRNRTMAKFVNVIET